MRVLFALALLIAVAFAARTEKEYRDAFTAWMRENKMSYASSEFHSRYRKFKTNLDFVEAFNAQKHTFTVATNKFAALSNAEYNKIYNGFRAPAGYNFHSMPAVKSHVKLPDTFDWRTQGAVTGVKNQAQCGSCWAFSTTGSMEGCHKLTGGTLVSLSEQNLMDCSWSQGNQGCNGGLMTSSMDYIIANGGIDTESSYPYTAESSQNCQYSASNKGSTLGSYTNIQSGSETDLQNKVSTGPTSVAIDASQSSFQMYSGGVYQDPSCSSSQLDHGVLAIGWGTDSGTDYWLVKNSWGTDWGMSGFIEMLRDTVSNGNMCGIATMATIPSPKTCGN